MCAYVVKNCTNSFITVKLKSLLIKLFTCPKAAADAVFAESYSVKRRKDEVNMTNGKMILIYINILGIQQKQKSHNNVNLISN